MTTFRVMVLVTVMLVITSQVERDEVDSQIEDVSHFLLNLIQRYDQSGKGAIPIQRYPSFLSEVLMEGHRSVNPQEVISQQTKDLLMEATTGFTTKYNTTQVGVQDFYFDLIKEFTTYLLQQQAKFTTVIETFFGDTPFADTPNEGYGEEAYPNGAQQVNHVEEKEEL